MTHGRYNSHWLSTTEIRWRRTCPTSKKHSQGALQTHLRLDRNTIHWGNTGLAQQKTTGALVNAYYRRTVSKCPNSIWRQETICNTKIDSTFGRRQSQTVHTTGMRKILIPWESSGQHPTLPDQHHCITIIQTDQRYDAAYPSTP